MPISYNNAFGGVDRSHEDPAKHRWYPTNHAGVGYHENTGAKYLDGKPLPNTEETGKKVTTPQGKYRPMAFGPIGRAWQPRARSMPAHTTRSGWMTSSPSCPRISTSATTSAPRGPADRITSRAAKRWS